YWNTKTQNLIAAGRVDQKSFGKTWTEFEGSAVSPEGKAYVAHNLMKLGAKPELWDSNLLRNGKNFVAYAKADPKTLNAAERSIWLNTNDPVVSSLDPIILADLRTKKAEWQPVLIGKQSPLDPCNTNSYFR